MTFIVRSGVMMSADPLPEVARFVAAGAAKRQVEELLPLAALGAHGWGVVVTDDESGEEVVVFNSLTRGELANLVSGPLGRMCL